VAGKSKHGRLTIGVVAGWQVYEGTVDSFLDHILRGILSAASNLGCNVMLACGIRSGEVGFGPPAWPLVSDETDFVPVGPWNTDGLIAVVPLATEMRSQYLQGLIADDHPVVYVGSGEGGPAVIIDNEGGIHQAMSHLVEHGHRRIAFVAGRRREAEGDSGRRLRAYRSSLREWGLEFDPNLVAHGSHIVEGGQRAMQQILDAGSEFTALLASNDLSAVGAMDVLQGAGMLVPQDVAVIGFDDRLEAKAHVPPLTTVHVPRIELGYQAVELLHDLIAGRVERDKVVRVLTQLAIRESCGCPSGIATGVSFEMPGRAAPISSQQVRARVAQAMSAMVYAETQRLSQDEATYLCGRLVDAFALSLAQGDSTPLRATLEQVLQRVASLGGDSYIWQAAISALRKELPLVLSALPGVLDRKQAEDLLHQTQMAIREIARGHHAHYLIDQASIADQLGRMAARFLEAQEEQDVFEALAQYLPLIDIQHAAILFYAPKQEDPVAWSVLEATVGLQVQRGRFASREFPPAGLYSTDRPFRLAVLPLLIQQELIGFVAFDATNLELCAEVIRQLAAAFRGVWLHQQLVEEQRLALEGKRLAEEANRLKSRFLSMVSHELRTPLNLISGLSGILLQESEQSGTGPCEVNREDLERIFVSSQHLDGLIRDVLDLAQSEVGQLKLTCEPLDLAQELETVSVIGEQLARDKGLGWRANIPTDLYVWGDRTRLRQVALNLVNNAVKFTAQGLVSLEARADKDCIVVCVQDTGLGIAEDEQDVIFDEFRQSNRTTVRGYGGLGLGLAICKRLVEMHGGEIGVQSAGEEGSGSRFFFRLPMLKDRPHIIGAEITIDQEKQVLLLVSDISGGELVQEYLTQRGFEVEMHQANQSDDWLSWMLVSPPDAVVLDLGLASERGWEVLKILQENPAVHGVPVLFYSLTDELDSGSLLSMDYLTKPVGATALADALSLQGLDETGEQKRRTVLIVDDDPGILQMHARVVSAQLPQCRILRAHNGREALDVIRQLPCVPDLILLDLMMPELDGFGVLEAMQGDEKMRNIPVIVLTGQSLTEEDVTRLNQGVASVLRKGLFSAEETLTHIEAALVRKRELSRESRHIARRAMAFVHTHYAEQISRQDVAAHVGVSERHLSRCFRQETGITLNNYLTRCRVQQAKALLETGGLTITEVAMEVGFSDSGYFARVFRREIGMSPSAFLRGEW
jgi:signal transduction histidine kinase/DNA-binding LacI/PurR family transcriptional regulator/DNA-binding response OmpR family regulator